MFFGSGGGFCTPGTPHKYTISLTWACQIYTNYTLPATHSNFLLMLFKFYLLYLPQNIVYYAYYFWYYIILYWINLSNEIIYMNEEELLLFQYLWSVYIKKFKINKIKNELIRMNDNINNFIIITIINHPFSSFFSQILA